MSDRSHIAAGDILRIGNATDADVEYVLVRDVPGKLSTAPDPGAWCSKRRYRRHTAAHRPSAAP